MQCGNDQMLNERETQQKRGQQTRKGSRIVKSSKKEEVIVFAKAAAVIPVSAESHSMRRTE